jgi:hypothetical protein
MAHKMNKKNKKRAKGNKSKKSEYFRSKTYYFGSTVGNNFWRRFKDDEFKDRDYGELWLTRNGVHFRRYFQMDPFVIPVRSISQISYGFGHAGKPSARMVMKIHWLKDGVELVSGFASIRNGQELLQWEKLIKKVKKD